MYSLHLFLVANGVVGTWVNIKLDQSVIKFVYVVHEVFSENTEQCEFSVFS